MDALVTHTLYQTNPTGERIVLQVTHVNEVKKKRVKKFFFTILIFESGNDGFGRGSLFVP